LGVGLQVARAALEQQLGPCIAIHRPQDTACDTRFMEADSNKWVMLQAEPGLWLLAVGSGGVGGGGKAASDHSCAHDEHAPTT
jgi:hypothetical protein